MLDPLSVDIKSVGITRPAWPKRKLLSPSPNHPDDYVIELDYSALSNFMICPRKAENYSIRSREAQRDLSALNFGHLFHELDAKRLVVGFTEDFSRFKAQRVSDHFIQFPPSPTDHRNSQMMETVMAGYESRYKTDGVKEKVLSFNGAPFVERPFKIELMTAAVRGRIPYPLSSLVNHTNIGEDGFLWQDGERLWEPDETEGGFLINNLHVLYTGRIDAALHDQLYWVMDDKTSSRGGQEFEENFRLSLQTRMYCWALQKIVGKPVAGLLLNAVIVRSPTGTGKGTEYNRRNYFYSPDLIDEAEQDIKAHVTYFINCLVRGFWPQVALSFKSPCPSCDYHENCSLPRAQRAADLASDLYRDVTWNPMFE